MRVALVRPGTTIAVGYREPLNLEYLGAFLESRGVETFIVDGAICNVEKRLSKIDPTFVGISIMTPDVPHAQKIADWCRKNKISTIVGGIHATIDPYGTAKWADRVIVGDGETALYNIVTGKTMAAVVRGEVEDISSLPPPARHLVDYEHYVTRYIVGERTAAIMTSRGCPWKCIYCWNSMADKHIPRYNSVERVIEEVSSLVSKYNIKRVFFQDDNLFVPSSRFMEIMRGIGPLGIKVEALTRATSVTDDVIGEAKRYGLDMVDIGFESASQKVLDRLNKQIDAASYQKAVDVCDRHGIKINCTFMVGNPGETKEDIELTRTFIAKNKFNQIAIAFITPYPGTKLWEEVDPTLSDWGSLQPNAKKLPIKVNNEMTQGEIEHAYNVLSNASPRRTTAAWIVRLLTTNPGLLWGHLRRDWRRILPSLIRRWM